MRLLRSVFGFLLLMSISAARAETVDLLLVLLTDVSGSIDHKKYALQKQGYRMALTDPRVLAAINGGAVGAIAISYIEFAGPEEEKTVIGWTVIRDAASAAAFGEALYSAPRSFIGRTAIANGIHHAMREISIASHTADRHVVDVCGDGTSNSGWAVTKARDAAVAAGIIINGLVILSEPSWPGDEVNVQPPGGLRKYYEENVIGGEGSFAMEANDFTSFGVAITRKLIMEISALPSGKLKNWTSR